MLGAILKRMREKRGQAMVESVLSLVFVLLVFLALFNLSDNIRVKLLAETAAVKCARARAVGYNDFQLRKIARLTMMPASGKCLTHDGESPLSYAGRVNRIGSYLNSNYETQANMILDFEGWRNGMLNVQASSGGELTEANVEKSRSGEFDFTPLVTGRDCAPDMVTITGSGKCETHYTDYLQ